MNIYVDHYVYYCAVDADIKFLLQQFHLEYIQYEYSNERYK